MNHNTLTALCSVGLLALPFGLPAQGKNASVLLGPTPAKPGYLNNGKPFSLRKAPRRRPPAYALPALPITHDPQPLPLKAQVPAQPLNPANGGGQIPVQAATIPLRRVTPIRTITIQARPTFVSPALSGYSDNPPGSTQSTQNAFLNPEILRYFDTDSNGTYQSRIRLNGNSLFTLPSMNPLLQRGGSTTYQIK
jgi:hypothetical protein